MTVLAALVAHAGPADHFHLALPGWAVAVIGLVGLAVGMGVIWFAVRTQHLGDRPPEGEE